MLRVVTAQTYCGILRICVLLSAAAAAAAVEWAAVHYRAECGDVV